jgi:DNA primase
VICAIKEQVVILRGLSPFRDEITLLYGVACWGGIWKDFSSGKGIQLPFNGANILPILRRYATLQENTILRSRKQELTDAEKSKYRSKESMYLVSDFAKDYFHQYAIRRRQTIGLSLL